jgi:hypothetical protein
MEKINIYRCQTKISTISNYEIRKRSSVRLHLYQSRSRACDPWEGNEGSGIIHVRNEYDWLLVYNGMLQFCKNRIFNRIFLYTTWRPFRSVRILFLFFRAVLYTNTTKEMQRNVYLRPWPHKINSLILITTL